ncbi:MAG: hypothetical protein APR55_05595 [Methanolinea sp. SDB]|nr:MAG: hypothetical protein APR55_05595 [Methanolinea sp. SDB]
MKRQLLHLIILFIACNALILVPALASGIQMEPSAITIQKGTTATVDLLLDDAPSGLAGYDLVVRFSNPAVAEISDVTYPSWAILTDTSQKSYGSTRIGGVDVSRQVEAGETDIPLATLKIKGISSGSSSIIIESVYMDADGGGVITPSFPTGSITVPGTSGSYSGGGGGSGSGVIQSTTSPTLTPSSTATQLQPTPTHSQTLTEVTTPLSTATINEPTPGGDAAAAGLPKTNPEISLIWIFGGIIVLCMLSVGAFIVWRRERE